MVIRQYRYLPIGSRVAVDFEIEPVKRFPPPPSTPFDRPTPPLHKNTLLPFHVEVPGEKIMLILTVCFVGSTVEDIAGFNLNNLLPAKKTEFYRYNGSLTTPDCYESVQWTVFSNPIEISAAQVSFSM